MDKEDTTPYPAPPNKINSFILHQVYDLIRIEFEDGILLEVPTMEKDGEPKTATQLLNIILKLREEAYQKKSPQQRFEDEIHTRLRWLGF